MTACWCKSRILPIGTLGFVRSHLPAGNRSDRDGSRAATCGRSGLGAASSYGSRECDWHLEKRDESTRFRHWLSRVTKNAILNALTRRPKDQAVGGSFDRGIAARGGRSDKATTTLLENQLRRELSASGRNDQNGVSPGLVASL